MKISHECPIDMLEASKAFNDYDYSLLHLMNIPEYKEFYKSQAKDRYQILDNSAFEYQFLPEYGGFNLDYYIDVINEVRPSSIIIPDVIGSCEGTIQSFEEFPFHRLEYKPEIIGVVQGENYDELVKCAHYMRNNAHKLAVVFHSPAYQCSNDSVGSIDLNNKNGRIKFVKILKKITGKPLHLLGCSLPQEFKEYINDPQIETVDTANPIQFGCLGIKYPEDLELTSKPKYIMDYDNMNKLTTNTEVIKYNISKFREYLKPNESKEG